MVSSIRTPILFACAAALIIAAVSAAQESAPARTATQDAVLGAAC